VISDAVTGIRQCGIGYSLIRYSAMCFYGWIFDKQKLSTMIPGHFEKDHEIKNIASTNTEYRIDKYRIAVFAHPNPVTQNVSPVLLRRRSGERMIKTDRSV
jgi:hypothetical protein